MASLISQLPPEVLTHVFSFLDRRSLGRMATVCHFFKASEIVQRFLCLSIDKDAKPPQITWAERVRVLRNLVQGNFRLVGSWPELAGGDVWTPKAIFVDNLLLQVASHKFHDITEKSRIRICNCVTREEISFDIDSKIIGNNLFHKTVFILNEHSEILCFNILTGQRTMMLNPDPLKQRPKQAYGKIVCSDHEIITSIGMDRTVTIWDRNSGNAIQTFPVPDMYELFACTSNYILFSHYCGSVLAQSRRGIANPVVIKTMSSLNVACANDYLTLFNEDGHLQVWKNTDKIFKEHFTVKSININYDTRVTIYQNWLLASKGGELHIYHLETGDLLFHHLLPHANSEFSISESQLLVRDWTKGTMFEPTYRRLTLYDLSS